jgi:hypothetical protein
MPSASPSSSSPGRTGDWLEVHGLPGQPPRRGQILEVLGGPGHIHYRVRWDERHESIFYPSEGTHVVPAEQMVPHDR